MTIGILAKYGPVSSILMSWLYINSANPTWAALELLAVWGLKTVLDTISDTNFTTIGIFYSSYIASCGIWICGVCCGVRNIFGENSPFWWFSSEHDVTLLPIFETLRPDDVTWRQIISDLGSVMKTIYITKIRTATILRMLVGSGEGSNFLDNDLRPSRHTIGQFTIGSCSWVWSSNLPRSDK